MHTGLVVINLLSLSPGSTTMVVAAQAPLQNIAPDWKTHSTGCYDAATLSSLRTRLQLDFGGVAEGVQRECLSRPLGHGMEEALKAETLRCDPDALGRLMADHTQVGRPSAAIQTPARQSI